MPFKGTDKKAYTRAGKFQKPIRSLLYKTFKTRNDMNRKNKISYSKISRKRKITNINKYKKNTPSLVIKNRKVIINRKYGSRIELVYNAELRYVDRRKINHLSKVLLRKLSKYTFDKAIDLSSRSFQITIGIVKIIVSIYDIYMDREKYNLIAEVIVGEATVFENYKTLEPFFKMHIDLFNQMQSLLKKTVIPL